MATRRVTGAGATPASVVNRPRSRRVSVYEPSALALTMNVRVTVSFAQAAPHDPLSVVSTTNVNFPCLPFAGFELAFLP